MNADSKKLSACIEGIGLIGPGFTSWSQAQRVLCGQENYRHAPAQIPPATLLPPAERRRAVPIVKLTLAAGLEAVEHAQRDAAALASVFSSSSGDVQNMHMICETLASNEREISPTRFHNSVHNAAAGYWSVATGATAASTALCAYDGSFAAGLLEALVHIEIERMPILLFAYDIDYPQPLRQLRSIEDAFCVVLALAPIDADEPNASIEARLSVDKATILVDRELETLRTAIPAARCLPLLENIAMRRSGTVVLDYLDDLQFAVTVTC